MVSLHMWDSCDQRINIPHSLRGLVAGIGEQPALQTPFVIEIGGHGALESL